MRTLAVNALRFALALALLAGAAWLVFTGFSAALNQLSVVRSDVATAIIAATATVAVAFISVGIGKYFERRETLQRELRQKKVPVYEALIASIFQFFQQGKPGYPKRGEAPTIAEQTELIQSVILWGSDSVLKQFGEFRMAVLQSGKPESRRSPLLALEDLMLAIRKDLGYANDKIVAGDVLRLFINDFAEYQAAKADRR